MSGLVGHFKIKYMFFCEKTYKKSIMLGGKIIRVAAFKLVSTKSFVFPRLKVQKYVRIYESCTLPRFVVKQLV